MIRQVYRYGAYHPIVVCDVCEKIIEDASKATVVFPMVSGERPGDINSLHHAHKGQCLKHAELQLGGGLKCGTMELTHHLLLLLENTKVSEEQKNIFQLSNAAGYAPSLSQMPGDDENES